MSIVKTRVIDTKDGSVSVVHRETDEGLPAGGSAVSVGLGVSWQNGPMVGDDGKRLIKNGAFVEDLIAVAIDRLGYYQETKFACGENEAAISALEVAISALEARTTSCREWGIEGTHKV
jgi:hypothetical protein